MLARPLVRFQKAQNAAVKDRLAKVLSLHAPRAPIRA
ncbi:hypothetical protein EDF18_3171 [Frigoribacterium sp. PhB107]|nr:hypothetical protein EDF18_3171 [Frigoribacterium sp. PhB107]